MRKSPRSVSSLEKAKRYVKSLELRSVRMPELLGFRSQDICKAYKQLLQTAASLAVVCMQTGDLESAWTMVHKAEKGEAGIQRFGRFRFHKQKNDL